MVLHARERGLPMLLCGGTVDKTDPLMLRASDLSQAVNDVLLSKLRNRLRHGYPRARDAQGRALWFD